MEDTIKFDRLVAEKRHKELLSALSNISAQPNDDSAMRTALATHTGSMKEVASAISKIVIPKIDTPSQIFNDGSTKILQDISNKIASHLDKVEKYLQPKEYTHTIIRDRNGRIDSVISKQQ